MKRLTRLIDMSTTQDRLGLSRSKVEDLIRNDQITTVKIGSARRVVEHSVEDYIDRLIKQAGKAS